MSKAIYIALIIFVLGFGYLVTRPASPASTNVLTSPMPSEIGAISSSGYLPYTPDVLTNSSTSRRVLFFYASWCPTCIPANADFEKNASMLPSDVTVIRVNYNDPDTDSDEKALAAKYGITYQHTYVQIDNNGGVITKWNGGATKELLANIK